MKLKMIAAAVALAAAAPAFAAIAPGSSGNGELFLAVYDDVAKVSYTLDLGITVSSFFATGQTTGTALSFAVADTYFSQFLAAADKTNTQWAVMGLDTTGGVVAANPGTGTGVNLFTTAAVGTTDAQLIGAGNNNFTNGMGNANNFAGAINGTGSHGVAGTPSQNDFAVNGSSFNQNTDAANLAYYGKLGGLTPTLNGYLKFSAGNDVGVASEFFALGRTGNVGLGNLKYDAFDADGVRGEWLLTEGANGYSLAYSVGAVPEPSTYALMVAGLLGMGFVARRRKQD